MYTLKPESLLNAFTCNNTKQWLVLMVRFTAR